MADSGRGAEAKKNQRAPAAYGVGCDGYVTDVATLRPTRRRCHSMSSIAGPPICQARPLPTTPKKS